ncbi:OmpH family outer membrane protein, partial [Myxococcota bacterium]
MELQTVFVDYNKELQKKQNELTQPIFERAVGVIGRLARQEGFDLVLDKQSVPYGRSDLDLTDRVITLYNQGSAGKPGQPSVAKPAAATPQKTRAGKRAPAKTQPAGTMPTRQPR